MEISPLLPSEYGLPVEWSRGEGWQKGDHDYQLFAIADPKGLLASRLNGEIVAIIAALNWDVKYASIGGYITKAEHRGKGLGLELFKHALVHTGNRETCLYAVPHMRSKYEVYGFVPDHQVTFYRLQLEGSHPDTVPQDMTVVDLATIDFKDVSTFNRLHFPASRDDFLSAWIAQPDSCAFAVTEANHLVGFGVMRNFAKDVYAIGPLYAKSLDVAQALLARFCTTKESGTISLVIPDNNKNVQAFVEHFHLVPVKTQSHMRRNRVITGIHHDDLYAIAAPDIG